MYRAIKQIYLPVVFLLLAISAHAQVQWPSPEIRQMYHSVQDYVALGNYKEAITTCRQAILLAPGNMLLRRELGKAQYLSGDYAAAEQTLAPLIAETGADTQCYRLLAATIAARKEIKRAFAILQKGLDRFPASGTLYYEQGMLHAADNNNRAAITAFTAGMRLEPGFAPNFARAASTCLAEGKIVPGLLYGELFLAMAHDTTNDNDLKGKLFAGYKTMFDVIATDGKTTNNATGKTFEQAVKNVYTKLTPVVSDGITTENLTMARTRFIMAWLPAYQATLPCSLFGYLNEMIASGHFDIYNQWLFGKAENKEQFEAWNTFHEGDIERFLAWKALHELQPVASDIYEK